MSGKTRTVTDVAFSKEPSFYDGPGEIDKGL